MKQIAERFPGSSTTHLMTKSVYNDFIGEKADYGAWLKSAGRYCKRRH